MKNIFYILLLVSVFSSCSDYQKLLKSESIADKFKAGDSLYNIGKYDKANKLFAQIVPNYKGKPQAEKLMYLYASSFFKMKDFYVAGYQFDRFVSSYPKSEKIEEAAFLSAKSAFMLSPVFTKDQKDTRAAIEKIQEFINVYPNSNYVAEANQLVNELDLKLQKKAFAIAKQYRDIAPQYSKDFNAAIKSFDNFIFEFPGSALREDALFYKFDAAYQQAVNSVEYKKKGRLEQAKEYYIAFIKVYADSKYTQDANKMVSDIDEQLKVYSTKS